VSPHTRLRACAAPKTSTFLHSHCSTPTALAPSCTSALRSQLMQHARSDRVARACVVAWGCTVFNATVCRCLHTRMCARVWPSLSQKHAHFSTARRPLPSHQAAELFGHSSCSTLGPIALHAHVWWFGGARFSTQQCADVSTHACARVWPSLSQKQAHFSTPTARRPLPSHQAAELFGHSSCSTLGPIALHAHVWWLGGARVSTQQRAGVSTHASARVWPSLSQKQAHFSTPTALCARGVLSHALDESVVRSTATLHELIPS
jgi:hypothetical protein